MEPNRVYTDAGQLPVSRHGKRKGKLRLLTRASLDGRTRAAQVFDSIANGIAQDLGGSDRLSTVQQHLVEAFAGAALSVQDLNARLLLGQQIDIIEQSQAISTMVRVASRIGLKRVAREVTPTLGEYLHVDDDDDAATAAESEREEEVV